jgi:putative hemolysin
MTRMVQDTDFGGAVPVPAGPEAPEVVFTYAHDGQSRLRRALIQGVEVLSGRNRLERLYRRWQEGPRDLGEPVFSAAVRALRLVPVVRGEGLDAIPATGGLLVVANHPFGIADGLALGHLVGLKRRDVKLMVHSLLCQPPEARDVLLPVDFGAAPEARRRTAETRRQAVEWLDRGHVVVIFPAGGVATSQKPSAGQAVDPAWHPFVARLATRPGVQVLPVHVDGQNSRLFQVVSHWSYPLRVALLFRETLRLAGRPLRLTVGRAERVTEPDKAAVTARLRALTCALAGPDGPDAGEEFVFPARIRW